MSNLEENLSWQTIALESALGDVADALATNKGMHCLVRRRVDQQAAEANACAAAEKVRRILKDSSDEALDLLVTLIEAKVEENASIVEVEDEICAAEAEVVVEMLAKELVDDSCAKFVVERIRTAEVEVGICDVEVEAEWIAINPLVDPGEQAVKVVVECTNKDEVLLSGGLDPGEGVCQISTKDKLEQEFGAREWVVANEALNDGEVSVIEMEEFRIAKVRVKECPNMEVLLCSGQLDPGEGGNKGWHWKEVQVKQELKEVWYGGSLKLLDFLGYEAEFVVQVPEIGMLRFVNWVSSSLTMIGDFG